MKFDINRDRVPLWKGANGKFQADVSVAALTDPFPVSASAIAGLTFSADGTTALGSDVKVGISASTSLKLAALFKEQTGAASDLVTEFELTPALSDTNLLLAFDLGGKASVTADGSYQYNVLSVGGSLAAGVDGRLVHTRAFEPRTLRSGDLLQEFFKDLQLPGTISVPPPPGQVTSLEFGGYLNFGVNASAGYQMKGTHDFQKVGGLKLAEHYQLSVTGKLSVNAKLAGRFSVEVRGAEDAGWARVKVKRQRSKELQIAADLKVGAKVDTQGLPSSGKEFLGSLLGLRAKNWINLADNLIAKAAAIQTKDDLVKELDGLANTYISKYTGKAVDQFLPQDVVDLMGKLKKVVDSYNNLENSAITLFDRYFDVAGTQLLDAVKELEALTSWDQLEDRVDALVPGAPPQVHMLWNVAQQLTGGNLLDFILKRATGLASLQDAAKKAISLIKDPAHKELRDVIGLAKKEFGLDPIVAEIARFDTVAGLKTELSRVGQGLVERIVGKEVDKLSDSDFVAIKGFIAQVHTGEQAFFKKFDQVLQEAASQSFSLDIAAAYDRADERTALIDVEIRLQNDDGSANAKGQRFMRSAGAGDFGEILAGYDPAVVRLHEGRLTHKLSTSRGLTINVAGWHNSFKYTDTYKVVTQSDQQIRPTATGMLNVFTTVEMSAGHDTTRKMNKHEQEMHSNFVLRFLAETKTTVTDTKFNPKDQAYLLDVITGQAATYTSTLSDTDTTEAKLNNLLAFAAQLGLDKKGANLPALKPILKLHGGSYGPVNADYRVQFSQAGLASLFQKGSAEVTAAQVRTILRRIIVASFVGIPALKSVALLYCSDEVREMAVGDPNFVDAPSKLQTEIDHNRVHFAIPFPGVPLQVELRTDVLQKVRRLFGVEKSLIDAFQQLEKVVKEDQIRLRDLEKASDKFGKAMNDFEDTVGLGDATNPSFAVFDGLIQLQTPASQARDSALALKVGVDGDEQRQMLFQLVSAPALQASAAEV